MTLKRAYSVLEVKSVVDTEEERIIEGIATTPTADRVGDIVEPMGAKFKLPMPLLWQHRHDAPVGFVEFAKPTAKGIPFKARIVKINEAGTLKDRVDEAWQSVKAGLVRAVSIGFSSSDAEVMSNGGLRFKQWEWLELSLVTIPANAEATIQTIKSIDTATRAATGTQEKAASKVVKVSLAGDTAKSTLTSTKGKTVMTLQEQLKAMREKRAQHSTTLNTMLEKSAETGETFDAAESETFDNLESEVKSLDEQIARIERASALSQSTATPVDGKSVATASASRGASSVSVKRPEEKGVAFAQVVRCFAQAKGNLMLAESIAQKRFGDDQRIVNIMKAAVSAGSTTDEAWAGALVGEESAVFADFAEFLRPQTILGQFGTGNIPGLRSVPFRVALRGQTSGGSAGWVGEGAGKPVTKFDFNSTTLEPLKVAAISVLTQELVRSSSPQADLLIRDQLAASVRERLDIDFLNPAKAAVLGVSPASITNGVTPIVSSGNTADNIRRDLRALLATYIAANNTPRSGVLVMSSLTALGLSLMTNPLGQADFPGLSMSGGMLSGIPVIVSDYIVGNSTGSIVVMVNASDIWLGDEGGVMIDSSTEASIQMDSAPTQNSVTPTGTTAVSMFQTNSIAIRAERIINWAKRRNSAVAYLSNVNWGASP